jgi:hypothetical protein
VLSTSCEEREYKDGLSKRSSNVEFSCPGEEQDKEEEEKE